MTNIFSRPEMNLNSIMPQNNISGSSSSENKNLKDLEGAASQFESIFLKSILGFEAMFNNHNGSDLTCKNNWNDGHMCYILSWKITLLNQFTADLDKSLARAVHLLNMIRLDLLNASLNNLRIH